MAFNVYKWRRDQLLLENSTSNDAGGTELIKSKQYSKEDIIKAVGMYGKIKLGSGEAIPVSSLDNEGKYTYTMDSYSVSAQKAVPVFIPAGKPKSIGSSDRSIDFQIKADKAKGKKPSLDEMEGDPDDYYGYNEPIDPNDYADDPGYGGDKIAILADALQVAWSMGKSNSQIDFTDMARRTMGELENGLNEALFLYSDEEMKKGASPKEYTDKEIDDMSLEAAKKLYKDAKNNWNVPHNHKLAKRLQAKIDKADSKK
jgi:hypothetical protein